MPFRLKAILTIAGTQAFVLALLIGLGMDLLHSFMEEALAKRAQTATALIANNATEAVLATDMASLQSLVTKVLEIPDIVYARILGAGGAVLAQAGDTEDLSPLFEADAQFHDTDYGVYRAYTPIEEAGHEFGRVEVGFSVKEQAIFMQRTNQGEVLVAAAGLGLTLLVSLGLGSHLSGGLRQLRDAAKKIASGAVGYQLPIRKRDELAETARAFNSMSVELREVYDQLDRALATAEKHSHELAASEQRIRGILEGTTDGYLEVDDQWRIQYLNPQAKSLLASGGELVRGAILWDAFPDLGSSFFKKLTHSMRRGESYSVEGYYAGTSVWLDVHTHPVQDGTSMAMYFHDITERKRSEEALRKSEARMGAIFENALDAIIITDFNGTVVSFNPSAESTFGYSVQEVIGQNVSILVPAPHAQRHDDYIKRYLRTGRGNLIGAIREVEGRRKDQSLFPMELGLSEVRTEEERLFVATIRDITQRKHAEEKARAAFEEKAAAETANKAKSRFLASMSHELRTPLNSILGYAQLFAYGENLTAEQTHNASEIYRAGDHLLALISDVLDLARIEEDRLELSMEPVSLATVVAECRSLTGMVAEKFKVSLDFERDDCYPIDVVADQTRLKQVLLNLLSNAIKYNREGGSVTLRCLEREDSRLRILVSDTGPGIKADRLDSLFQPFDRLGAEGSDIEGTGIGLTITKQLVEMMGGTIGVESTVGTGSMFWVEFQRAPHLVSVVDDAREPDSKPDLPSSQALEACRILAVEDNLMNQDLLLQQLALLGYTADVVANGEEGLRMWRTGDYALVLSDINMPIMDGYQLVGAIRETERAGHLSRTPVIAITANALKGDAERVQAAGMDDYVPKPVDLNELKRALNRWLPQVRDDNKRFSPHLDATKASTEVVDHENPPIDPTALGKIVGDDPAIHQRLLNKFIATTPNIIREIHEAHAETQAQRVGELAHKLKSSARAVGANALADLCQSLEQAGKTESWEQINDLEPRIDAVMAPIVPYVASLG